VKTEVQQESPEAAAGEDSGSCVSAVRSSALRIAMGIARQKSSEFIRE